MNVLISLIQWCLTHTQTIAALLLISLIAFVAGAAWQYVEDDKKAAQHGNAEAASQTVK